MTGLIRRARAKIDRAIVEPALVARGFEKADCVHPGDTVIVGFPKSGHTWMQGIVAGLKYGVDAGIAPDTLIQDLVPDLHQQRWRRRYSGSQLLKSHHLPRPDFQRVIYLIRDGRDVLVSYYHWRCAYGFTGTMHDLLAETHPTYATWQQHVELWTSNPFGARLAIVFYEVLLREPARALHDVVDMLDLDVSEDHVDRVAEWCRFERMQRKEQLHGWDNPRWPQGKRFLRRGVAGAYADEMDEQTLKMCERDYKATLAALGYKAVE